MKESKTVPQLRHVIRHGEIISYHIRTLEFKNGNNETEILRVYDPDVNVIIGYPPFWDVLWYRIKNWDEIKKTVFSMVKFYKLCTLPATEITRMDNLLEKRHGLSFDKVISGDHLKQYSPSSNQKKKYDSEENKFDYPFDSLMSQVRSAVSPQSHLSLNEIIFKSPVIKNMTPYHFWKYEGKVLDKAFNVEPKDIDGGHIKLKKYLMEDTILKEGEVVIWEKVFDEFKEFMANSGIEEDQDSGEISIKSENVAHLNFVSDEIERISGKMLCNLNLFMKNLKKGQRKSILSEMKKELENLTSKKVVSQKIKTLLYILNNLATKKPAFTHLLRLSEKCLYYIFSEFNKITFGGICSDQNLTKEERRAYILMNMRTKSSDKRLLGQETLLAAIINFPTIRDLFYRAVLKKEDPEVVKAFQEKVMNFYTLIIALEDILRTDETEDRTSRRRNKKRARINDLNCIYIDENGPRIAIPERRSNEEYDFESQEDDPESEENEAEMDENESNDWESEKDNITKRKKKLVKPQALRKKNLNSKHVGRILPREFSRVEFDYIVKTFLTSDEAKLFELIVIQKYTDQEIADMHGVTQQSINKKIQKIYRKLREIRFVMDDILD